MMPAQTVRAYSSVANCSWFISASILDEEFDEFDGDPLTLLRGACSLGDCIETPSIPMDSYIPSMGMREPRNKGAGWKPRVLRSEKAAFARQEAQSQPPPVPKPPQAPPNYFDGQIIGRCRAFAMADGTFQLVPMRMK